MSNEDKVKVVLTRPALERLIGGDSELEIQLRHAAAKEIVKKHVVSEITDEVKAKAIHKIASECQSAWFRIEREYSYGSFNQTVLTEKAKRAIAADAERHMAKAVTDLVAETVSAAASEEKIAEVVKTTVNARVKSAARRAVDELIDDLIQQKTNEVRLKLKVVPEVKS